MSVDPARVSEATPRGVGPSSAGREGACLPLLNRCVGDQVVAGADLEAVAAVRGLQEEDFVSDQAQHALYRVVTYSWRPSGNSMTTTDPLRGGLIRRPATTRPPLRPSLRNTTSTRPETSTGPSAGKGLCVRRKRNFSSLWPPLGDRSRISWSCPELPGDRGARVQRSSKRNATTMWSGRKDVWSCDKLGSAHLLTASWSRVPCSTASKRSAGTP